MTSRSISGARQSTGSHACIERGTPMQFLKSFTASALFERCKLSQSLPDIFAVGATILFCLSGPLVTAGVTAYYIITRGT